MPAPIAIQLYSVRDALASDYAGVVRQMADMGYAGVEPAGFPGTTPAEAGKLFKELGLAVPSAHVQLPLGEHKTEVLDTMSAIDCRRIVTGRGPDGFKTMDQIRRTCEIFNEAHAVAVENDLMFGIHNHWWEFQEIEGRAVYEVMLEILEPGVFLEIDTYWVQTAGADPIEVVRTLGPRAPMLHLKDGPCVQNEPMVAVGDGIVDFPGIVEAGAEWTQWIVVELDHCATDMIHAVRRSYDYLVGSGLASGREN